MFPTKNSQTGDGAAFGGLSRRAVLGGGLAVALGPLLAACSGGGSPASSSAGSSSAAAVKGGDLDFWSRDSQGNGVMEDVIRKHLQSFDSSNGTTTDVQFLTLADSSQKELAALVGGGLPTLGEQGQDVTMQFASGGHLMNLDDVYAELKDKFSANLPVAAVTKFEDHVYGLPWWLDSHVLFYHKDLVETEGLTPPTTWDEWLDFSTALTKGTDQYGFVFGTKSSSNPVGQFLAALGSSAGGTVLGEDGKLAVEAEPFVDTVNFLEKLYTKSMPEATPTYDETSAEQLFIAKKVASMWGNGALRLAIQTSNPELLDNLGAVVTPAFDSKATSRSFMGGYELFAFDKGKTSGQAKNLLKHMYDPTFYSDLIKIGGGYLALPTLASAADGDLYADGVGKVLIDQLKTSVRYGGPKFGTSPYMGKAETNGVFSQPVIDVWGKQASASDSVKTMIDALKKLEKDG